MTIRKSTPKTTRETQEQDREARVTAVQARPRRSQRGLDLFILGSIAVVVGAFIAVVAITSVRAQQREAEAAAAAKRPIEGVRLFPGLSRDHVTTDVQYPQTPPVGGDHSDVWQNCGTYTSRVPPMQGVHSLEHGAVWIGYRPGLDAARVAQLTALAEANSYVLLSPVEGVAAPVVASAWGRQLAVESAADPRLETFVRAFQQGPDAPEPGAPCMGGADGA